MQFIPALQNQRVPHEANKLGACPVVRHVADDLVSLANRHLLLTPRQQRRSMVAEGVKRARGLVALAEPKPGMTVERPEVGPDAVLQPAGVLHQALLLYGL